MNYSIRSHLRVRSTLWSKRNKQAVTNADQYALEVTDRLKQAFQFVYEYSGHVAERMKSNYDAAIKPKHFEVKSFVLVYTPPKQQSHVYGKWHGRDLLE